jgi:hypothetical protein
MVVTSRTVLLLLCASVRNHQVSADSSHHGDTQLPYQSLQDVIASASTTSFDEENEDQDQPIATGKSSVMWERSKCSRVNAALQTLLLSPNADSSSIQNLWETTSFALHRNGEASVCGRRNAIGSRTTEILRATLEEIIQQDPQHDYDNHGKCNWPLLSRYILPSSPPLNKLETEAFLTRLYIRLLEEQNGVNNADPVACASQDEIDPELYEAEHDWYSSFASYCDRGPDLTPQLSDYDDLIQVKWTTDHHHLPCRFHTREGVRITSLAQLRDYIVRIHESSPSPSGIAGLCHPSQSMLGPNGTTAEINVSSCVATSATETADAYSVTTPTTALSSLSNPEVHLFAVSAGRVFMFAPGYIGETFHLPHVAGNLGQPISIEVLSLNPRVFEIHNFFDPEEAADLVNSALTETSEVYKLHRSTTGQTATIFNKRTSENAWDTHGKTASRIKRRCLTTLGFDEYMERYVITR